MPQGLTNAPDTFQRLNDDTSRTLKNSVFFINLDSIYFLQNSLNLDGQVSSWFGDMLVQVHKIEGKKISLTFLYTSRSLRKLRRNFVLDWRLLSKV